MPSSNNDNSFFLLDLVETNFQNKMFSNTSLNFTDLIEASPDPSPSTFNIVEIILATLTIIINLPLMLFIIFNKRLRAKKPNVIFLNMQLAHVLHSIMFLPTRFNSGPYFYHMYNVLGQGFVLEFFLSMALLTLERLIAVKDPFNNSSNVTSKQIAVILILSWCIPVLFIIPCIHFELNRHQYLILNTILVFVTGCGLILANGKICFIARQHSTFIKQNAQHYRVKRVGNVLHSSFVCFAVVMTFVVLWFPYFVHHVLLLTGIYRPAVHGDVFTKAALFIAHINSFSDPIMFVLISNATIKEFKELLSFRKQQSVVRKISTVHQDTNM